MMKQSTRHNSDLKTEKWWSEARIQENYNMTTIEPAIKRTMVLLPNMLFKNSFSSSNNNNNNKKTNTVFV